MTKLPDESVLLDIQKAAELAMDFVKGMSREQFEKDLLRQSGTMYQLTIIGEAATQLSKSFKAAHPEVPWKMMAGMRNILIHVYRETDLSTVWDTVKIDLPKLLEQLRTLSR